VQQRPTYRFTIISRFNLVTSYNNVYIRKINISEYISYIYRFYKNLQTTYVIQIFIKTLSREIRNIDLI